jgi:hypothetical protein
MLIRLANSTLTQKSPQKPKKKRPELTLVTVTTRNDVDIEPGYHRGANHYLITNTFGNHRLYSLTVNRKGLTAPMIVDDVMKRLRQTAGWTKVVAHGPNFHPVEVQSDTSKEPVIGLKLGDYNVGFVIPGNETDYRLVLDKDLDGISLSTLSTFIHEFLKQEIAMAADENCASNAGMEAVEGTINPVKAFMLDYEKKLGSKLNFDEWQDLIELAYDSLLDDEEGE